MGYGLGVDLGTTYTAAASIDVDSGGGPVMLGLGNRALQIPSVLYLQPDGDVLVGEAAERRGAADPGRVVREFKRRIGDHVPILIAGAPYSAQALTARLLGWVLTRATERLGEAPARVMLTHPANWGEYKLDLLRQAAALADLLDAALCPEPVAAALQYASRTRVGDGDRIAVYDLGGGTFDVSVLAKTPDGFTILGTPDGIEHLGGIDFDEAVFRRVLDDVGIDLTGIDRDDQALLARLARLRRDCVEAKEALSSDVDTVVAVSLPDRETTVRLTRAEFEDLIRPALDETVNATRRALRSAEVTPEELSAVVLVGGSSRIPLIAELLSGTLHTPVASDTHPKHDIAMGAARASTITLRTGTSSADAGPARPASTSRGLFGRRPKPAKPVQPIPGSAAVQIPTPATPPPRTPTPASAGVPAGPFAPAPAPAPFAAPPGPQATAPVDVATTPSPPVKPGRPRSKVIRLAAVAAVLVIAATGGAIAIASSGGDDPAPTTTTATSALPLPQSAPLPPTLLIAPLDVGGNVDLYVVDSETGRFGQRLTTNEGQERAPALSPDRETLIYVGGASSNDKTLRVMAVNGDGDRELFSSPPEECATTGRPAWNSVNPDQLALVCIDNAGQYSLNIFTINGALQAALAVPDLDIGEPTFSPDGTRVAYWANESSDARGGSLYWSAADGSGEPVQLTDGQAGLDGDPMWSPDGAEIAFHRRLDDGAEGNLDIFVIDVDGGQVRSLAPDPASDSQATWSPDGSQLAFSSRRERPDVARNWEIWIVNRDGSNLHPMTNVDGFANYALAWGPR
ncbi:MAG: Hsp70 family protein [Geodermatophilaceae bacterium]|nr:Hsp70 family protein [Geodermatophilaceae bacterium]